MNHFNVDLFTPDKVVAEGIKAKSIKVSTTRGEIGVLPEHTHLITKLFTGLLCIESDKGWQYFTVSNGICKILGDHITILSGASETKDEIDKNAALEEIKEVEKKLLKTDLMSDDEIDALYSRIEMANARLKLLET